MKSTRTVAVEILEKIDKDEGFSNIVINKALANSTLNSNDKALCSALVYGVLVRKLSLDYIISNHISRSISKTDLYVLWVLRVAVYQIAFMDKIPDFAIVNEAILTLKSKGKTSATGFVNAVLRSILKNGGNLLPSSNDAKDLSVIYSVNEDFVNALIKNYGLDIAVGFLKASVESPNLYARVNTLVTDTDALIFTLKQEGVSAVPCEITNAISVSSGEGLVGLNSFSKGMFHIQDLASQIAINKLDIKENMRILDICSAPGGKSFTAAQYLKNTGEIVSCDLYENRVNLIRDGANRLGITNLTALVKDASVYDSSLGKFDRIICDVPCSGFGVIRRKPEIRYKKLDDFKDLPEIQFSILSNAVKYLKDDGVLMYSTCTLRKTENERVVERFIKENPDFEVDFMQTLMPQKDGTDGFFICLIRR